MAVPPKVANANAQVLLDGTNDNVTLPPNVRAFRSSKRLEMAHALLNIGSVTAAEVGNHEVFHAQCCAAAAGLDVGGLVPPPWFVPALEAGLAPLVAGLAPLVAAQAQLEAGLAQLVAGQAQLEAQLAAAQAQLEAGLMNTKAMLVNISARQMNSVASDHTDLLTPVNNADGVPAANFPATLEALINMTGPDMTALLGHYDLPADGNNDAKRHRIKNFIGLQSA